MRDKPLRPIRLAYLLLVAGSSAVRAHSDTPANYLFLGGSPVSEWKSLLSRDDIAGAQVVYTWRSLEPSEGRYDFSAIERDLGEAEKLHRRLFVQVQDRFFQPAARNVPGYLLTRPEFDGGLAKQDDTGEGRNSYGWVAKQWNPAVRTRFQALLSALAKQLDGRVAGINLPESAADVDRKAPGFSCDAYFRGELENAGFAVKVFHRSTVVQYINFWPCEWNDSRHYMLQFFDFAVANGVGLGGPDIAPGNKAHMKNAYPFFHRYKGRLKLVAMAVQEPTLTYVNPATGKRSSREEITAFARDYLGADLIFWTPQAPWLRSSVHSKHQ